MLKEYREYAKARAAEQIPPLPLAAEQAAKGIDSSFAGSGARTEMPGCAL